MIATWMAYCTVIGLLLAGAAHLVERMVLGRGGSTRRIWLSAILVAVALPGVAALGGGGPSGAGGADLGSNPSVGAVGMAVAVDVLSSLDRVLLEAWVVSSALLACLLLGSVVAVARRRRAWTREEVDGVPVLVSEDVGPAVVGILRQRIVLPRWAVTEDAEPRALLLRHEQEHVAAGDPRLIFLAALLVVAMPWNLAVWRLAGRLRVAVETDCDRRVMGCPGVDPRRYGALLLSVGRRRSGRALAAAIGFSRSRSLLETRIDRMTWRRRQGLVRTAVSAVAVVALVAAAWTLPQPVRLGVVLDPTPCPGGVPGAQSVGEPSSSPSSGSSRAPFSSHTA